MKASRCNNTMTKSLLSSSCEPIATELSNVGWHGNVTARILDLRLQGQRFDSRSGHCQVISTSMADCLQNYLGI